MDWTLTTLGASTLAAMSYAVWARVKRDKTRSDAEATLDQRVPNLIKTVVDPFEKLLDRQAATFADVLTRQEANFQSALNRSDGILAEERKEKLRVQDERDEMVKLLIEQTTKQSERHHEQMNAIREEFRVEYKALKDDASDTAKRLHARVDECEKGHEVDRRELAATKAALKLVEERQFQTALSTPPPAPIATPVLAQPHAV